MAKTIPLSERLIKMGQQPRATAPKTVVEDDEATAEPKPEKPLSILTPIYTSEEMPPENYRATKQANKTTHCAYELTVAADAQFPKVARDASPFLLPLKPVNLVDLVFCEFRKSKTLQERFRERLKNITFDAHRRRSTLILPNEIRDHLHRFVRMQPTKALSLFMTWLLTDWDFIKTHITYKGIK